MTRVLISIIMAGLFVMLAVWFVLFNNFLRTLKKNHSSVWQALGQPALLINNTPKTGMAVLRYLKSRAYQQLGDKDISAQGDRLSFIIKIYLVLFVIAVGLILTDKVNFGE